MPKQIVIHKRGQSKHAVEVYQGLGNYNYVIPPVCEGGAGLYRGRSYLTARSWKHVTCKKCLAIKEKCDVK